MPGNLTGESFLIALSGIVIVFLMLAVLSGMIVLLSKAVGAVTGRQSVPPIQTAPVPAPAAPAAPAPVRLEGVNELTAACIMAIVSDELGTTPDQLVFRSIKAL